jgi:hypothetical protein
MNRLRREWLNVLLIAAARLRDPQRARHRRFWRRTAS